MKVKELIKIAKTCSAGNCDKMCPFKPDDMQAIDATITCQEDLIKALADKLEMAVSDIRKNCGNCMYKDNDYRELPCSICRAMEFDKWEWRGNAE